MRSIILTIVLLSVSNISSAGISDGAETFFGGLKRALMDFGRGFDEVMNPSAYPIKYARSSSVSTRKRELEAPIYINPYLSRDEKKRILKKKKEERLRRYLKR